MRYFLERQTICRGTDRNAYKTDKFALSVNGA